MYLLSLVGSVRFENGTYNFSENSVIRIILILSQPSSNKVTVTVDFGNTATGETTQNQLLLIVVIIKYTNIMY